MHKLIRTAVSMSALLVTLGGFQTTQASTQSMAPRHVDLALALDVSGSMDGLIESAKQRLWDITNELARMQPQPILRVAILSYGNPEYGERDGYVRINQAFTNDLDAVNQTLFGFTTNGGDEYVARVIRTSVNQLQWTQQPDALRMLYVAGNESANQDPIVSLQAAAAAANKHQVFVSTIYCNDGDDSVVYGWQQVANMAHGMYATIDQNAAAVANIETPVDEELASLSQSLNETYVAFGHDGDRYRANQVQQDKNAKSMSEATVASRAVTKASKLYDAAHWDLVDALEGGVKLEDVESEELPAEMQTMSLTDQKAYLAEKASQRGEIKQRIAELNKERISYIEEQREQLNNEGEKGLDEVLQSGLRQLATKKGFTFSN